MNIKNLGIRTISGVVYVCLILASVLLQQPWFSALTAAIAILSSLEFNRIVREKSSYITFVNIADAFILFGLSLFLVFHYISILIYITIIARFIYSIYDKYNKSIQSLAYSLFSYIYIGVPLLILNRLETNNYLIVLALFVSLWINDTGAYIIGSMFGKHKLLERISPKKTWEGFAGGLFFNLIAAYVIGEWCIPSYIQFSLVVSNTCFLAVFVCIVSIFGTLGDLIESLFKRSMNIKDAGNIIPGHGGILDRIDSLLLATPVIFIFLQLLRNLDLLLF